MAFTTEELQRLEALLATSDGGSQLTQEIRGLLPGRSLTRCDACDMGADEPFRRFPRLELYLVDGRDHCWQLTGDPAIATGIVVAVRRRTS